jgi:hypothetical protein
VYVSTAPVAALGIEKWKIPVRVLEGPEQLALVRARRSPIGLGKNDGDDQIRLAANARQSVRRSMPLEMVQDLAAQIAIRLADLQNTC